MCRIIFNRREVFPVDERIEQDYNEVVERIRRLCLSFENTSERLSHRAPTFFVNGKKSFVMYHNNHHGDGRVALWCAAPAGVQSMLVETWPELYFVPAYVGHYGWVGIRLDRNPDWPEIARVISDGYETKAGGKRKAAASPK
jgi:hypothetical protein